MKKTLIIAEAGVNHNGDLNLAKKLIEAATKAGADVVKFQSFKAELCASKMAVQADYQAKNTGLSESQVAMLKRLELPLGAEAELLEHCERHGVEFLSTAGDLESLELVMKMGLKRLKIPSGELTDLPYLRAAGRFGGQILLSTGMANLGEVEAALLALEGSGARREDITLLHCTSEYPAPFSEVNLRALKTLREAFGLEVGFSDHTEGITAALGAVALGARVIEKHFTLDKTMSGPDHRASLEPCELKALCEGVRQMEAAMGDGLKRASASEAKNIPIVRKSLVARIAIKKGEEFSRANLTTKRPGSGVSAMLYEDYLGRRALRDYEGDELIDA